MLGVLWRLEAEDMPRGSTDTKTLPGRERETHALHYNRQTRRCEVWYHTVGLMGQFCCRGAVLSDHMLQQQAEV